MPFIKKLVGWFFTYPPYRDITETQSEGVVSLLALALHADGEPHEAEREELERELTGVPHFWANEAVLREIVRNCIKRLKTETFATVVRDVIPRLEGLNPEYLLVGAAFICNGDDDLTALERTNLSEMGRLLGLDEDVIDRIVLHPTAASEALFQA
jgi:hypothetical protein